VTLNANFAEQTGTFSLKSNQAGTQIDDEQIFKPNTNDRTKAETKAEYAKLSVTYEGGVGTVSILDNTIAKGTYTFVCEPQYTGKPENAAKITLKVKINQDVPKVTAKGTLSFNKNAKYQGAYTEDAVLTFTAKNLPEGYEFDEADTIDSIRCTSKVCDGYEDNFNWSMEDEKLTVSLKKECKDATYSFSVEPTFKASVGQNKVTANKMTFKIKVYTAGIKVTLAAKGKMNLIDRTSTLSASNSIVYTPKFTNLQDQVVQAKVYSADDKMPTYGDSESTLFDVTVQDGLLYVRPAENAELENNKTYKIQIWMQLADYKFDEGAGDGIMSQTLSIKTAQSLPKVTSETSTVNLYLSNKSYEATFIVDKQEVKSVKPAGTITDITFGEKDEKALSSFANTDGVITSEQQEDGSLKVTLKLNNAVAYSTGSTNKIKMYVNFEGQGTNATGTAITMNVKINR
jgi:hypothetical protein